MGERPFSLVYGTEAMIPIEVLIHIERVAMATDDDNKDYRRLYLALAEEKRNLATIHLAHSNHKIPKYYTKRVRSVSFKCGDHVMRNNKARKAAGQGKLSRKLEGPYIIHYANDNGSCLLTMSDREDILLV
ncbi:hypothetical protein Tco_1371950 [Tanacetum coccineum]